MRVILHAEDESFLFADQCLQLRFIFFVTCHMWHANVMGLAAEGDNFVSVLIFTYFPVILSQLKLITLHDS